MSEARVEDLAKHVGETVTLRGWLYHRRSSGKLHFLEVRDGSGIVQGVVSKQGRHAGGVRSGRPHRPGVVGRGRRRGQGARAHQGAVRDRREGRARPRRRRARVPDRAEGARDRLLDGPPPPLAPVQAPARHRCGCATRSSRRSATSSTAAASRSSTRRSSRPTPARGRARSSRPTTTATRRT